MLGFISGLLILSHDYFKVNYKNFRRAPVSNTIRAENARKLFSIYLE